jgi:hypothetical protein
LAASPDDPFREPLHKNPLGSRKNSVGTYNIYVDSVWTRLGLDPWSGPQVPADRDLAVGGQGCYLRVARGSHGTPWHPVEDPRDPLQPH